MASPKVFVSSTCFDLGEVREQLSRFIEGFGFEAVLSEHGDVFYHPDLHTHDACIHEVSNCQLFILIIGGRYGGEFIRDKSKSITNAEYVAARESNIPVFTYIRKNVLSDHYFYIENRKEDHASKMKYPNIDKQEHAIDIFNFIDDVRRSPTNNAFESFDTFPDMENHLRKQWAGMFFDFLKSREIKAQIDTTNHLIEGISSTSNKLEELVKMLYLSTNEDKNEAQHEIESLEVYSLTEQFFKDVLDYSKKFNFDKNKIDCMKMAQVSPLSKTWREYLVEMNLFEYSDNGIINCIITKESLFGLTLEYENFSDVASLFNSVQNSTEEQRFKILESIFN